MISLQSPRPSFVAHFDMLGMTNLIRRDTNAAWSALCELFNSREYVVSIPFRLAKNDALLASRVRHFAFSDTIVLYTMSDAEEDLFAIVVMSTELFSQALAARVPLRGAIAHGLLVSDESMRLFTGPALVDAYQLGEEAQWLGITVQDEVARRAAAIPLTTGHARPVIVEHSVPLKGDKTVRRRVVDWPNTHRSSFKVEPPISPELLYSVFTGLFGEWEHLSETSRRKYENTVAFINQRLSAETPIG